MYKVLIYGSYGIDNLGDDFMMIGVNNKLISNDIKPYFVKKENYNCYFKNDVINFYKLILFNKKSLKTFFGIIKWYLFDKNEESFNSLILMGGGYTNEDFGINNLIKIFLLCKKFKKLKKNIYFTGQTVGPFKSKKAKFFIKKIYKMGKYVYTREIYSQDILKQLEIDSLLIGDDAYLCYKDYHEEDKKNVLIINYKSFKNYDKFKEKYFSFLKKFVKNKNYENVYIIPFRKDVDSKEYLANYELHNYFKKEGIESTFVIERNINKFLKLFCESSMVIGSAYHSVVLALMTGNDVIGFYNGDYYKNKITGILKWYNIEETNAYEFENIEETNVNYNIGNNEKRNITKKIVKSVNNGWDKIIEDIRSK